MTDKRTIEQAIADFVRGVVGPTWGLAVVEYIRRNGRCRVTLDSPLRVSAHFDFDYREYGLHWQPIVQYRLLLSMADIINEAHKQEGESWLLVENIG